MRNLFYNVCCAMNLAYTIIIFVFLSFVCSGAAMTDITIEEVEKDGKYVRITNRSASKVLFMFVSLSKMEIG